MANAVEYAMASYGLKIGACALCFAIGSFLYSMAACKCLKENLSAIQGSTKHKTSRKLILEQMIEFIGFHSQTKQLSASLKPFWLFLKNDH